MAAATVIGCAETASDDDAPHAAPEAVEVHAAAYGDIPEPVLQAFGRRLTLEAAFRLTSDHPDFGGLSGLWIGADGSRLIAVSDVGQRWEAGLSHDGNGRLTGVDGWTVADLPGRPEDGAGSRWIDAESLAGDDAHGLVVGYEGEHRLRRWPLGDLDATPDVVTLPYGLGEPQFRHRGSVEPAGRALLRDRRARRRLGRRGADGLGHRRPVRRRSDLYPGTRLRPHRGRSPGRQDLCGRAPLFPARRLSEPDRQLSGGCGPQEGAH
ncbi:MAG: hypothetical protein HC871_07830 [Rhizobiales bacterium]|nr:hypothetical protein [Hyphomicrobiales bacterium]